ncbi:MAG: phage baseplate assembly protein V [Synergistaceae bacterium]|nr:phage baseplate assembly protein V [Synergistaceae bacterium]
MRQNNEYASVMRIGRVCEFSPEKHAARVLFPDIPGKISDWLPLLTPNSHADKSEHYVDVDEHVVCLMSGQGDEFGVILGSFYDGKNEPPFQTGNAHTLTYADGTMIQYDRASSTLSVHCVKDITIETDNGVKVKAGNDVEIEALNEVRIKAGVHIKLEAPRIDLN